MWEKNLKTSHEEPHLVSGHFIKVFCKMTTCPRWPLLSGPKSGCLIHTASLSVCLSVCIYIYIWTVCLSVCIYIYIWNHENNVPSHHAPKCMRCCEVILVTTRSAHCFRDFIYINLVLLLHDLSTLYIVYHLQMLIYIYICLYVYMSK